MPAADVHRLTVAVTGPTGDIDQNPPLLTEEIPPRGGRRAHTPAGSSGSAVRDDQVGEDANDEPGAQHQQR